MPFGGMGIWEVLLILLVLLLVFGAKRLPELGGALGKGIREFKSSVSELESEMSGSSDRNEKELKAPRTATGEHTEAPAPQKEPVDIGVEEKDKKQA